MSTATKPKTRVFLLDFPWEMRAAAGPLGAKWDKSLRAFTYVGSALPPALVPFGTQDYSWERWKEDDINGAVQPVSSSAVTMKPRPHQLDAAKKIVAFAKKGYRGFIEADEVGLGKTISTLLGAYGVAKVRGFSPAKPAKLLIVCPKGVVPHWRNTIKALGLNNLRVTVINYDRTKSLLSVPATAAKAKKTRTKNKHIASSGKPLVEWDIIVADESHKLKSIQTSQRAKAFDRIARYSAATSSAPFVIWASATIGQNPIELGYLAPLIAQMTNTKSVTTDNWGKYLADNGYHVVKGKVDYSWVKADPNKPNYAAARQEQKEDILRLRKLLFNPSAPSIRRLPTDIIGWPEIQHVPVPVAFSAEETNLYRQLWTQFRSFFSLRARGQDPRSSLAAQMRFRQKASMLRVPGTVDQIVDLLDNGLQVAVSVEFMESLDAMSETLKKKGYDSTEFTGRNSGERDKERLRFQRGEVPVIFFSVEEGISLHAGEQLPDGSTASRTPRATVVHDVRYSALSNAQIAGRCHRDGQHAVVYMMYAQGTVEEKITKVMVDRMSNMRSLSGDAEDSVAAIEALLDAAAQDDD